MGVSVSALYPAPPPRIATPHSAQICWTRKIIDVGARELKQRRPSTWAKYTMIGDHAIIAGIWFIVTSASCWPSTSIKMYYSEIKWLTCNTAILHAILSCRLLSAEVAEAHRRFRGIECRVLKICDLKKVIFSHFFKHNIAGFGLLIPKRYHMLG